MARERGFDAQWLRNFEQRALEGWKSLSNTGAVDSPTRKGGTGVMPRPMSAAPVSLPRPLERDIQAACLECLAVHPAVAWAHRFNTGVARYEDASGDDRIVRFAFKGCSDILGQMKDGRFLAVECKRIGEHPTPEQTAFLLQVHRANGLAFVARSVDDVLRALA